MKLPVLAVLLVGAVAIGLSPAMAQVGRDSIPSTVYRATLFGPFNDGDYRDALKEFLSEGRGAIKSAQTRWIDSICYHTMAGECYYHMGELPQALDHYTSAVKLYVAFSDWMIRVRFPQIRPVGAGQLQRAPWGASSRNARPGYFSRSMQIGQGQINVNEQIRKGGVIQQPILFGIDAREIVRCTTLAIRRRTELMGPACRYNRLTGQLLAALQRHPGPPNHWSEAWLDVQLGLALVAAGKESQAVAPLKRSVVAAGQFDHPMTSIAMVELGRLAMKRGDWPRAASWFEEATYPAVQYYDAGVLEEAFRYGALVHLTANRKGIYPPLVQAIRWAKQKRQRQLHASLLLLAAENYAVAGETKQAASLLDEARGAIGRRDMAAGRIGARLVFLRSGMFFRQGKIADGNAALATAMSYMRHGSHWMFHIGLADRLYMEGNTVEGGVTARTAMELYAEVLRDPGATDWTTRPMESLAVLTTPHPAPFEHWFEVAFDKRNDPLAALEIADRCRRHRYFSSLPFGGRLQSLRWILAGPGGALDREAELHRRDLLARFVDYDKLAEQARQIRARLEAMPLVVHDTEPLRQQKEALAALGNVSRLQEAVLREIAVRREPAGLIFPPLHATDTIQQSLPKGHALLVFFATRRHLYGFLINQQKYTAWRVGAPTVLARRIAGMLRDMGQYEQNRELSVKELADTAWKESGKKVLDAILKGSKADFATQFDELIIVPDGLLWYVPFEALQVRVEKESHSLISRVRIRYAPTASLAIPDRRGRKPMGNTAVALGRLFPRDNEAVAQKAFDELAAVLPGTVALPTPLPAPSSVYGVLLDRLIVLDDLLPPKNGPYSWAPIQIGRGRPGNTLDDWLSLPWGGPQTIILPGYHTAAERALRGTDAATAGTDMFLSLCGILSSGTRTVLISRWRTGGRTSFELVREFAQELPHTTPPDAWQRAVLLVTDSPLRLEAEPRIKRTAAADDLTKAEHPLFWAGYMLVDSGTVPEQPAAKPGEEERKPKKLNP